MDAVNQLAAHWAEMMWHAVWQGSLTIGLVWLICRLRPTIPAAARAWLWRLCSIKLLVSFACIGAIVVPILPQSTSMPAIVHQTTALGHRFMPHTLAVSTPTQVPLPNPIDQSTTIPTTDAPLTAQTTQTTISPLVILIAAWMIGLGIRVFFLARRAWALRRLVRDATSTVPACIIETARTLATEMGLRRAPMIVMSNQVTSPLVVGPLGLKIVLPRHFEQNATQDEIKMALAHELGHVRRDDLWMALVPTLTEHLFYFLPLAALASRECAAACEEACDALVLRVTGAAAPQYARLLLKIVGDGSPSANPGMALGMTSGYQTLRRRLVTMLETNASALSPAKIRQITALALIPGMASMVPWHLTARADTSIASIDTAIGVEESPAGYAITELKAANSYATDINNNGQIIGASNRRAVLWQNGTMRRLGVLPKTRYSVAARINNNSQIIAASYNGNNRRHAFLWESGRQALDTLPGYRYSEALGINDAGDVVGAVQGGGRDDHGSMITRACLWTSEGVIRDLGTLGGDYSAACGINNRGQIVGKADLAPALFTGALGGSSKQTHAFVWQDGHMTDLGALGGHYSRADSINNAGQIVGFTQTAEGPSHAFLSENGQMQDLGTLAHDTASEARSINDAGMAVGCSRGDETPSSRHAVLWYHGKIVDLNSYLPSGSGWILLEAFGINDLGQIVGEGRYQGKERAFLLTPTMTVGTAAI